MNRKSGQSWPFRFHLEPASQTLMQFFLFMICNIQKRFKFQLIFGRLPGANKKNQLCKQCDFGQLFKAFGPN